MILEAGLPEGKVTARQFSLLNDEPVTDDRDDTLGSRQPADHLASLILASRASTPFTLAVDAGWGMGKSSVMHLMRDRLDKAPGVHTIWYNAWTAKGGDSLEGLIKSVLTTFDRGVLRRGLHRAAQHGAALKLLRALLLIASGPFGASGLVDDLWKTLSADSKARNEMRDAIKEIAKDWAEAGRPDASRLLVVFIDDLDRCSAQTVLGVCEAIKLYLDIPGLAFVVGCDRSVLGPEGLLRDLPPAGAAFMEKIFQTNFQLHAPTSEHADAFVRRCARRCGIEDLLDSRLIGLLVDHSRRNPRNIKRLLNGFVIEAGLNPLWQEFGPEAAIRTVLLQYLYPDFYRVLVGGRDVDVDALTEFAEYRRARSLLRRPEELAAKDWDVLRRVFSRHDVVVDEPALSGAKDARERALIQLEQQSPTQFKLLAADHAFTALVTDLTALPDADELLRRLRQLPLVQRPVLMQPPVAQASLRGRTVLWVDDHPDSVRNEADALRHAGAVVAVVGDREAVLDALRSLHPDVLISDIARGSDPEAGFRDIDVFRKAGFSGSVVFYTGRVTPAREARAAALGALGVCAYYDALRQLVFAAPRSF